MSVDFSYSFSIRPDTPRVQEVKVLNDFIESYPDEELTPNLRRLGELYRYYRPICGDGNCFYRACIFLYFCTAKFDRYEEIFPKAPIKDCQNLPFSLEEFNVDQVLQFIWKTILLPMQNMNVHERRKELLKKLNGSVVLDAVLIAYFRSLTHQYLSSNRELFASFIEGDLEEELAKVLNFGREAQGIELFALAEKLKVRITIMMVHKENFQQIVYMEEGRDNFVLFLRPGHYDILCEEEQYRYENGSGSSRNSPLRRSNLPNGSSKLGNGNILTINNAKDLSRLRGKSDGFFQRPLNTHQFYGSVGAKKGDWPASTVRRIDVHKKRQISPERPQSIERQKNRSPQAGSQYHPASKVISNMSSNRLLFEGAILVLIIGLVFNLISI